jgi:hypothetical protein
MWARNLLFVGVVAAGVTGLGWTLYPQVHAPRVKHFDPAEFRQPAFQDEVVLVDTAIRQPWAELDVQPAPLAGDLAVARRLSLALTGTIPSVQEIRQLEAQPEEQRLQWWLSGVFQDRRYADYFAERLARTYVGTEDGPFIIYRRRRFVTWLSDELMRNHSYGQIVREIIATEGLWTDKPATNFITVTIEPDNKKGPNPERLAGRVTRAFLGIRLDCAQCHNHPFQKWTQHDFQGLAAFFGQVQQGFTGIYDGDGEYEAENRKTGARAKVEPGVPFLQELLPTTGTRREQLARWVTDPRNVYFSRATVNRVWALMFGRPLVEPVDDLTSTGDVPAALQLLADDFTAHHYDLQRLIRLIAASEAFQRDSAADHEITDVHEHAWAAFPLSRLRPEQVAGSLLQASSLATIDQQQTSSLVRAILFGSERDFVKRYGDTGDDEFDGRGGTIPQRLLLMNGQLVKDRTKGDFLTAPTRISWLAADDRTAVETAYLAVLTRRPTAEEAAHFEQRLAGLHGEERSQRMEDLYWTLLNSTEFSWNH